MKRVALMCAVAVLGFSGSALAQLTMQMGNGWSFTVAGNVNAFGVYTTGTVDDVGPVQPGNAPRINGSLVPEEKVTRIRTGLLPAFFTAEVRGNELGFDLAAHFGFAPQINSNGSHDNFGAQIDMRQVYMTVGGKDWGQILVGRELGLYQRHNILTDLTLFGAGPTGGGTTPNGGTTLGRIGFGYLYPNFNAQLTYSSPSELPLQIAIGLFDPSEVVGDARKFSFTKTPRIESEITYTQPFGAKNASNQSRNTFQAWVGGLYQHTSAAVDSGPTIDGVGGSAGVKLDLGGLSLVGSGYVANGLGTTLMFDGAGAVDLNDNARTSWGYIAQVAYALPETKFVLGGGWGEGRVEQNSGDSSNLVKNNSAATASVQYNWTKSLKQVVEATYAESKAYSGAKNSSWQGALGLMLFF
jgi:predicted porin